MKRNTIMLQDYPNYNVTKKNYVIQVKKCRENLWNFFSRLYKVNRKRIANESETNPIVRQLLINSMICDYIAR